MKNEKLFNALGKIDDNLIYIAAPKRKNNKLLKKIIWSATAACLTICIFSTAYMVYNFLQTNDSDSQIEILQKGLNAQFLGYESIDVPLRIIIEDRALNEIVPSKLSLYTPSGDSAFKTDELLYFADSVKDGDSQSSEDNMSSSDNILYGTGINKSLAAQGLTLKYDKNLSKDYSGSYYSLSIDNSYFSDGVFISQDDELNTSAILLDIQTYKNIDQTVEPLNPQFALKDCFFIGSDGALKSQIISISDIQLVYVNGLPYYTFQGSLSADNSHSYSGFALAIDGSKIENGANLIASSIQTLTSKSDGTNSDAKPRTTITNFFDTFEESNFNAMEQYCTTDFISTSFHGDNVWGMKWAKISKVGALVEDVKSGNAAIFVSVQMIASPDSALYQGNEEIINTSFFITLLQGENGSWLVNGMQTSLPTDYDINSESTQPQSDDAGMFRSAITDTEYAQAKKAAEDFYNKAVQSVDSLEMAPDTHSAYANKKPGSVIVFEGRDSSSKEMRHIVVETDQYNTWVVTGEGY